MSERKVQVRMSASTSGDMISIVAFAEDGKALTGPDIVDVLEKYINKLNEAIKDTPDVSKNG